MRNLVIVLGSFVLILAANAFATDQDKAVVEQKPQIQIAEPAEKAEVKAAPKPPEDKIAVTVNGKKIMESEIQKNMPKQMSTSQTQSLMEVIASARKQTTEKLIVMELLNEQIDKKGISVTPEEAESKLLEMVETTKIPIEAFKQQLARQGTNYAEHLKMFREGMHFEKLMDIEWAGKVDATDEEIRLYYDVHVFEFETPEQVNVSHILIRPVSNKADADPDTADAAAKVKAEELLKQLKGGADFADLARGNSDCPSKEKGGELGAFPRGQMVRAFEDVAFALEAGKLSDVVKTRFGYHIIKLNEKIKPRTRALEEMKDNIADMVSDKKKRKVLETYVEELKANAEIVYPEGTPEPPAAPIVSETASSAEQEEETTETKTAEEAEVTAD